MLVWVVEKKRNKNRKVKSATRVKKKKDSSYVCDAVSTVKKEKLWCNECSEERKVVCVKAKKTGRFSLDTRNIQQKINLEFFSRDIFWVLQPRVVVVFRVWPKILGSFILFLERYYCIWYESQVRHKLERILHFIWQ